MLLLLTIAGLLYVLWPWLHCTRKPEKPGVSTPTAPPQQKEPLPAYETCPLLHRRRRQLEAALEAAQIKVAYATNHFKTFPTPTNQNTLQEAASLYNLALEARDIFLENHSKPLL